MQFPVYRKYPNNLSFFKIISADEFEELKIFGGRYSIEKLKAKILPDRNFIMDMIAMSGEHWVESSKEEYENALRECEQNKKLV